eukprot:jgi/Mesvir1/18506/Mv14350-RA.1
MPAEPNSPTRDQVVPGMSADGVAVAAAAAAAAAVSAAAAAAAAAVAGADTEMEEEQHVSMPVDPPMGPRNPVIPPLEGVATPTRAGGSLLRGPGFPVGAPPLLASVQAAISAVASARPAPKRKAPGGPPKPRSKPKWQQELEAKLEAAEREKALVEKALAESRGVLEAVYRTCHFCTDPFGDNEDDCPVKYALPKVGDKEVEHKCPTISCAKCAHTVLYTKLGNHCCPYCRAWVVSYKRDEEMSKTIFEDINVQYCAPCDKVFPIGGHAKHA